MSINFTNKIPEWKNKGTEPSDNLKNGGFTGGYKPPASVFNWFWNRAIAAITELQTKLASHTHTKSEVGLGNVDNTSDANKPVSTAVQTALNSKSNLNHTHYYAGSSTVGGAATSANKLTSTFKFSLSGGCSGSVDIDGSKDVTVTVSNLNPDNLSKAVPIGKGGTGATTAAAARTALGLGNVDNTSDANKPVSTAVQTALNGKANSNHTHNYAGSTSAGGDANSAKKLSATFKFSITGGATGSVSGIDGSADVSLSITSLDPGYLSTYVPISKGGTGAANAQAARSNLGLGSAATYSVVNAVPTSTTATNLITGGGIRAEFNKVKNRTHIVIAASDTQNPLKAYADYICTATDAADKIKQALSYVAKGGIIELLDGNYRLNYDDGEIIITKAVTIKGCGYSTVITQSRDSEGLDTYPIFTVDADNVTISDMMLCDRDAEGNQSMILIKHGATIRNIFFIVNDLHEYEYVACVEGTGDCRFSRIKENRMFKGFNEEERFMFDFSHCTNFSGVIGENISSGYNNVSVKFANNTHKNNTAIYGHTSIDIEVG